MLGKYFVDWIINKYEVYTVQIYLFNCQKHTSDLTPVSMVKINKETVSSKSHSVHWVKIKSLRIEQLDMKLKGLALSVLNKVILYDTLEKIHERIITLHKQHILCFRQKCWTTWFDGEEPSVTSHMFSAPCLILLPAFFVLLTQGSWTAKRETWTSPAHPASVWDASASPSASGE